MNDFGAGSTGPPPKTFPKIQLHDPRTHPRISTSTTSSIQGEHVWVGEQIEHRKWETVFIIKFYNLSFIKLVFIVFYPNQYQFLYPPPVLPLSQSTHH